MKKIFETEHKMGAEKDTIESVMIYGFEDEYESEDFEILSHNEQIATLKLKAETATPSKEGTKVTRYCILDVSEYFVTVKEMTYLL